RRTQGKRTNGQQGKQSDGPAIILGKTIDDPTPEEISDAPCERGHPQKIADVLLRNAESAVQIHRKQCQDWSRRDRWQAITEDERPKTPLAQIGKSKLGCFFLGLRKKRRTGNDSPDNQPNKTQQAGIEKRIAPSIFQPERHGQQRSCNSANRPTAERQC